MDLSKYNPFPIDDGPLEKLKHIFEDGKKQRVRVKATNAKGVLETINKHQGHIIRLDSGHLVECREYEIEPEDYHEPSPRQNSVSRVLKAQDPFPIGDEPTEPDPAASPAALQLLAPFLKASGGLQKALSSGTVSAHDQAMIKTAMDNIKEGRVVTDPFGEIEDHNTYILRIMAEKYAGTSASTDSALHKAAGGDRVDELIRGAVDGLNAGHNIVLPSECRIPFSRVPSLQALVASGRICFDYAG